MTTLEVGIALTPSVMTMVAVFFGGGVAFGKLKTLDKTLNNGISTSLKEIQASQTDSAIHLAVVASKTEAIEKQLDQVQKEQRYGAEQRNKISQQVNDLDCVRGKSCKQEHTK